ncbi:ThiJ/PfpI family protein [Penicillium riverlandense]|uniref:ThiJ/PfpI family protein n=1 Tax=Penicillium riverlandense TaxID=1903569 RepID=UPI0025479B80|nr:ThiJ/PfpI family protein [Penicillium riverlandense]KAJ5819861.1 ThiJ/PfpI family protein [Penicillium riverlandense]
MFPSNTRQLRPKHLSTVLRPEPSVVTAADRHASEEQYMAFLRRRDAAGTTILSVFTGTLVVADAGLDGAKELQRRDS